MGTVTTKRSRLAITNAAAAAETIADEEVDESVSDSDCDSDSDGHDDDTATTMTLMAATFKHLNNMNLLAAYCLDDIE